MNIHNWDCIVIGTSAGGVSTLQRLFSAFPVSLVTPIVVIQHLPPKAEIDPPLVYGRHTHRSLVEACDKMEIQQDSIYFAPPDYHLLIEKDITISLSQDEPVHYARPSIDVAFESAAYALGQRACGLLLTGANSDGSEGLNCMSKTGSYTIIQAPSDAEFSTMPKSALKLFDPNFVGTITEIASHLEQLSHISEGEQHLQ